MSHQTNFCLKCPSNDSKTFAFIYDLNIEGYIRRIYIRLKTDIDQYRNQLRLMNDTENSLTLPDINPIFNDFFSLYNYVFHLIDFITQNTSN